MIFRLDDHLSRFENSCEQMEIKIPYSRQEVKSICIQLVEKSQFKDAIFSLIGRRGPYTDFTKRDLRTCKNGLIVVVVPLYNIFGMDKEKVAITATFDGSQILLFGAVKRDKPAPIGDLQVIVTVAGPSERISVHRKSKVLGIWMNTETVEVDAAPSFYAVATSSNFLSTISLTIHPALLIKTAPKKNKTR